MIKNQNTYKSIIAKSHTDPYKIHKYFARRPWNIFSKLIEEYSQKGQIILDPFCGGGTTIYESLKLKRKAIGLDINPLSILIIENMLKDDNIFDLEKSYLKIDNYLKFLYLDLIKSLNRIIKVNIDNFNWMELSHQVECPNCKKKVLLIKKNQVSGGIYKCNCKKNYSFKSINAKKKGHIYLSLISNSKKNILNAKLNKLIYQHDKFLLNIIKKKKLNIEKNKIPTNWDRQLEDGLKRKKIIYFEDLFTKKNLYINILLKSFINELDTSKSRKDIFRFILSSSLKDTNIMSFSSENWQSGKPTSWSKHAYWLPPQFCENNVRDAFKNAYTRMKKSILHNKKNKIKPTIASNIKDINKKELLLINNSINNIKLPKNLVDIIITDPPYGHNVQYLELSHFWFNWNKDLYNNKKVKFKDEAISNRKKFLNSKSIVDYENNLKKVFIKSYEILKPGGNLIMTFNNKNFSIFLALLTSVFKSGFLWKKNAIFFQDGVLNYKQTSHTQAEGSPYGDFIYIFEKPVIPLKGKGSKISKIDLINKINNIINSYSKKKIKIEDLKIEIFKKIIPHIQSFYLNNQNPNNGLYEAFNVDFLKELYEKKNKQFKNYN